MQVLDKYMVLSDSELSEIDGGFHCAAGVAGVALGAGYGGFKVGVAVAGALTLASNPAGWVVLGVAALGTVGGGMVAYAKFC